MDGLAIVFIFGVIYAIIKVWRASENADAIDNMPWPHGE